MPHGMSARFARMRLPAVEGLWRGLPWLVALVLAALLLRSVYGWWTDAGTASANQSGSATSPAVAVRAAPAVKAPALGTVAALHLFGQVQDKATPVPLNAPDSTLNLVLHGVFDLSTPSQAMAIIADAQGHQRFYRTGDKLPGQSVLYRVYADRVILRRAGHFETLRMAGTKHSAAGAPVMPAPVPVSPVNEGEGMPMQPAPENGD